MTGFSGAETLATPWRVIRRHPLAVLVWGLIVVVPSFGGVALVFSLMAGMPIDDMSGSQAMAPDLFAQMMQMQAASLLVNIVQMVLAIVVWAAANRATLRIGRPERAFFLRLGLDELRLAVVGLALFGGVYLAMIIVILLGAALGIVVWQTGGETAGVVFAVLMVLAGLIVMVLALARVSLIAPAGLVLGRFGFSEGWALARGQTVKLAGLMVASWLIYMLTYFSIIAVIFAAMVALGAFQGLATVEDPQTFADAFPSLGTLAPWMAAGLLPIAFLYGVVMTLLTAPFASACRQLMDNAPPMTAMAQDGAPVPR